MCENVCMCLPHKVSLDNSWPENTSNTFNSWSCQTQDHCNLRTEACSHIQFVLTASQSSAISWVSMQQLENTTDRQITRQTTHASWIMQLSGCIDWGNISNMMPAIHSAGFHFYGWNSPDMKKWVQQSLPLLARAKWVTRASLQSTWEKASL